MKEVRGLGLMWAIEFTEPQARRPDVPDAGAPPAGLFAQLVVVPLFRGTGS